MTEVGMKGRQDPSIEVTETHWNHNGTLFVTVRSEHEVDTLRLRRMRRLARRALPEYRPGQTRSSRVTSREDGTPTYVTFAVSRNER